MSRISARLRITPRLNRILYATPRPSSKGKESRGKPSVFLWSPSHPSSPMGRRGAPRVAGLPGEGAPPAGGESPIPRMEEWYIQNISLRITESHRHHCKCRSINPPQAPRRRRRHPRHRHRRRCPRYRARHQTRLRRLRLSRASPRDGRRSRGSSARSRRRCRRASR